MTDKAHVKAMAAEVGITIPPRMLDTTSSFYDALWKLCEAEALGHGANLTHGEAMGVLWALREMIKAASGLETDFGADDG